MPIIGKPFSEEADKKLEYTPLWNQNATDKEGRRRFHGAFTGGFTAGYYGTVGSKEGFTPQTFKSSRKARAEIKEQDVKDFLDDEDFEGAVGGQTLATKEEFSDNKKFNDNLIILKGKRDFSELGIDDGTRKRKKYGPSIDDLLGITPTPPVNNDKYFLNKRETEDQRGFGYISQINSDFQKLRMDRIATNDDDDDKSNYDFELDTPSASRQSSSANLSSNVYSNSDNSNVKCSDGRPPLPFFNLSQKITVNINLYPPPKLPEGYVPKKKFETTLYTPLADGRRMDYRLRAEILGEKPSLPPPPNRPAIGGSFDSYEKELRYKKFLRGELDLSHLSKEEQEKEFAEFREKSEKFSQIPELMQSRFTTAKGTSEVDQFLDSIKKENEPPKEIYREISDWAPHRLVCKRFAVANPYERSTPNLAPKPSIQNVDTFLMDLSMNRFTSANLPTPIEIAPQKTEEEIEEEKISQIQARPSDLSIFKAIFADDDEDE